MPRTDRRTLAPLLALALLGAPALGVAGASTASAVPASAVAQAEGSAPRLIGTSAGGESRARLMGRQVAKARSAARPKLPARTVGRPVAKPVAKPVAVPVALPTRAPVVKPVTLHRPYDGPAATPSAAPSPAAIRLAAPVAPVALPATETQSSLSAAASTSYKFLNVDLGNPVRWNPCQSVPWTFNPANAPAGGRAAVQAAMAEISRLSGLRLAYTGDSSEVPSGAYLKQSWRGFKPLLIGWTTPAASDMLTGHGPGTVGVARVLWTGSYADDGSNRTQIASATVALNAASRGATSGPGSWYTWTLHELGHAFGLAHVDDDQQIMNPVINARLSAFGAGDAAGLRAVGAQAGCLPTIR